MHGARKYIPSNLILNSTLKNFKGKKFTGFMGLMRKVKKNFTEIKWKEITSFYLDQKDLV